MTGDWKTIKTYTTQVEASLAQSVLEQHGIFSMLQDHHMGVMYGPGIGGVKLLTPPGDIERALTILADNPGD